MASDLRRGLLRWRASCILLALAGIFFSDSVRAQEGKVIVLERTDSLVARVIDGEDARDFIGHVRILQDNVHISCDRALQFIRQGRLVLTGNVVVTDDSVTLRAPEAVYMRDERTAEATGSMALDDGKSLLTARYGKYFVDQRIAIFRDRVRVRDSVSVMTADSLTYYRNERRSVADGRVTVINAADRVTITGGHLDHRAQPDYSRMTVNPVLVQLDTSAGAHDTLLVRGRVMEAYRDSVRRLVASDSVEIVRADLAAVCGRAVFHTEADSILLRKSPIIWYRDTQVTGDSVNVYLKGRQLHRVDVTGEAFAISRSDSVSRERYDQLNGEKLRMLFVDKVLHRIDVEVHATSVYHLTEDSVANGLNKTSGDTIIMVFEDGKVRSIKVTGGVEGRYVPENLVKNREEEYRIPGFRWIDRRPTSAAILGKTTRTTVQPKRPDRIP
jgi:lipopolysaccharide export system protein LptA